MAAPSRKVVSPFRAGELHEYLQAADPVALQEPAIFAEGDSWFSKFFPARNNLLDALDLRRNAQVFDHSWSGDQAVDMLVGNRLAGLKDYFDTFRFHAILLSAGGNDVIAGIGSMLDGNGNASRLVDAEVGKRFDELETLIRAFCDARATSVLNAATPILIHAYDRMTPRDAPVIHLGIGPWVRPRLVAAGVTAPNAQKRIVDDLLGRWFQRLLQMVTAGNAIAALHVLHTQGTLDEADSASTGRSGDWEDEIHPTRGGFRKITTQFYNPLLDMLIP